MAPEKKGLIVANGAFGNTETGHFTTSDFDVIIAADGGWFNAQSLDLPVTHLIGDFDSTELSRLEIPDNVSIIHAPSQEQNDLEKALLLALDLNVQSLTLVGLFGKRTDHTLNNLSVLARYDRRFQLTILEPYSQVFLVRDRWQHTGSVNRTISLIPLGIAEGVTTRGLAFPLRDETLEIGGREGLSNMATAKKVEVTIRRGLLAIFAMNE